MCHLQRELFNYINKTLETVAPKAQALHFCHSEGGVITYNAIKSMTKSEQDNMRLKFYIEAIAPASCIPKYYAKKAENYYSTKDSITGWFAKKDGDKYKVKILQCLTPLEDRILWGADHSFTGHTYKNQWSNHLNKLAREGKIHVHNRR